GQVAGLLQSLLAIEGGVNPIAVEFQLQAVHLKHRWVVFHEKHIDQVFVSLGCAARAGAAARLTFHNTPLGAKQYRRTSRISRRLREAIRRTPYRAYAPAANSPRKS